MSRGRLPPRSQTTPELSTLQTLLTAQEAAAATNRPPRRSPLLVTWYDIPLWQKDNQWILTSYRPPTDSYMGCFQSLFYLHNESVNIHSHIFGTFLFFFIGVFLFLFESYQLTWSDLIALSCFFIGVELCLTISASYHLISNHSAEIARFGNQLDYVGIVALIAGSFIPSVYYGFHCEPLLQRRYWLMVGQRTGHIYLASINENTSLSTESCRYV